MASLYQRIQNRIRDLLLADPLFAPPVKVLIEDREGLAYMLNTALGKLSGPVVTITTLTGTFDNRAYGACIETVRFRIQHHTKPLMDKTDATFADRIQRAVELVFQLSPEDGMQPRIAPEGAFIFPASHTDISVEPGVASHELVIECPIQHLLAADIPEDAPDEALRAMLNGFLSTGDFPAEDTQPQDAALRAFTGRFLAGGEAVDAGDAAPRDEVLRAWLLGFLGTPPPNGPWTLPVPVGLGPPHSFVHAA
jgi:hypothetical protein